MGEPFLDMAPGATASSERLDSWKEIAAYLNRDVTTVQRWEKREGMPVHRHLHDKRGSVYALTSELDAWREGRRPENEGTAETESTTARPDEHAPRKRPATSAWGWVAAALVIMGLSATVVFVVPRFQSRNATPPRIRSIAVLPLRNISGDSGQDYLAEGLTEALIDRLSSIRDLRVISHTSVMRFKDPKASAPEIARTLGVDALVEGSVIRDGGRIRVTAQLIRGATDEHFWSQTYDREIGDALSLESELAQSIADRVQVTLTGEEQQRLEASRPVAPEVYESYLKGQFALNKDERGEYEHAIAYFDDAIRRDAAFAPAYLGLAEAYGGLSTVFIGAPPEEGRRKVMGAVRKALELDPNLAEAHDLLANVLQDEWRWSEAEAEYQRTLALNPNDAEAYAGFAEWLICQGRADEAVQRMNRARELDPLAVSGSNVAWILFQSHRYEEAEHELRSVLALQPQDAGALWYLSFVLIAKDEPREAVTALEKAADVTKRSPGVLGVLVRAYAHAGRRNDALRVLSELKDRQRTGYVPAAAFVNAYLGLGDKEEAFVWLEKACNEKSNILQSIKTHPYFDPIRSDPRFKELVHRVGLG